MKNKGRFMNDILCIYHGNCADGFGAAWVVWQALHRKEGKNLRFHPGVYGEAPPNPHGRDVIIVDFSYSYETLCELAEIANSILLLDHHESAVRKLQDKELPANVEAIFDTKQSGAMLAARYFMEEKEIPLLIHHIQDRDLWQFKLAGTRQIQAALFSYPYHFLTWSRFMLDDRKLWDLQKEGEAIERKHFKDIDEFLVKNTQRFVIGNCEVPVANLPYFFSSDAGHKLAEGEAFAACYWFTDTGAQFSLRSTEDGINVAKIAELYNGGGHPHAAGFTVSFGDFVELFLEG